MSDKPISRIKEWLNRGYTWEQIGDKLGVAPSTAHRWYYGSSAGVNETKRLKTDASDDNSRIRSMLDAGYTWERIGDKLGVAPSTAHRRYYNVDALKKSRRAPHSSNSQKKYVEDLAVALVIKYLGKHGISTEPGKGTGCDLLTSNGDMIEVKGMAAKKPGTIQVYESVFRYMDEHKISKDKYFLYLVHDILNEPQLTIVPPQQQKWSDKNIKILDSQSYENAKTISL
jgi:hypothetical protein